MLLLFFTGLISSCSLFTNRDGAEEKDESFTHLVSPVNTPHVTKVEVAAEFYENQDAAKELGVAGVSKLATKPVSQEEVEVLESKSKKARPSQSGGEAANESTAVAKFEPSAPPGTKAVDGEPVSEVDGATPEKIGKAHGQGPFRKYKVKNHDTLMKISYEQYGTIFKWRDIFNANKAVIKDYRFIRPGQILTLNGKQFIAVQHEGEIYLILKNDSLGKISQKVYGDRARWRDLWKQNRDLIKNPNKIYAGFHLYYNKDTAPTQKNLDMRKPAEEN